MMQAVPMCLISPARQQVNCEMQHLKNAPLLACVCAVLSPPPHPTLTCHFHQVRALDALHHMLQEASVLSSHLKAYKPAVESYTSAAGHFFDSLRDFMASSGATPLLYSGGRGSLEFSGALACICPAGLDVTNPRFCTACAPEDRLYICCGCLLDLAAKLDLPNWLPYRMDVCCCLPIPPDSGRVVVLVLHR